MAGGIHEEARTSVYVDGSQAKNVIGELTKEAEKYKKAIVKANAEGDLKAYKVAQKDLERVTKEMRKLEKEAFDVDKVLRNLNGASISDLYKAQRKLNQELKDPVLKRNSKDWNILRDKLVKVKTEVRSVRHEMNGTQKASKRMFSGMSRYAGMATASLTAMLSAGLGVRKSVDDFNTFEETGDSVQALTKLTDEQMTYLQKKAKETSVSMVEDNVRITKSATEILGAYAIMGSKRPDLLAVKEDLHSVTQEAMILAAAAKEDLNPSVEAVAISLNQFEYGADQARRVINTLAAGSQAGAGDIKYLNQAIEKSGTTFKLMKLDIEDNAAAIETIAPYYAEASQAGNSLDKVMMKLRKNHIGYKDGVFDMNRALDELEQKYANGESAVDIFGEEHAKTGELLVKLRGKYNEFREAVTGTNTAIEQAATNTDNNNSKKAQELNKIKLVSIALGEKLSPALTTSIGLGAKFLQTLLALIDITIKYSGVIIPAVAAVTSYAIATKLLTLWQNRSNKATIAQIISQKAHKLWTEASFAATQLFAAAQMLLAGNTKGATQAMRAFNTTTKASPIGILLAVLVAVGSAWYMYKTRVKDATIEQKEFNEVVKESNDLLKKTKSIDERAAILKTMNKRQLEDFKMTLNSQVKAEEDFQSKMMQKLKKRLSEDAKLNEMNEKLKNEQLNAAQRTSLQLNIYHRKKNLARDLEEENRAHYTRIKQLKQHLTETNEELKKFSDNSGNGGSEKEKSYQDELRLLTENFEKGLMTQVEYETQRDYLELFHLESRLEAKQKAGKDTLALEKQIANKRLAIQKGINDAIAEIEKELDSEEDTELEDPSKFAKRMSDEAKARLDASQREREANAQANLLEAETDEEQYQAKIELESIRFEEELERIGNNNEQRRLAELNHKTEVDKIDQDFTDKKLKRVKMGLKLANNLLSASSGFFEAQKQKELAAAGDNAEKKEAIERKYAEKQKKVAIAQALIAGALGIMQIWATPSTMPSPFAEIYKGVMTGLLAGTTIAQVGTIKSAQFAEGRYPVMGASDGNVYQTQYVPDLKTGVYSQPSIGMFSEVDPEMVVDGATTKRLMFDYPEVYSGILSLSRGGAPQFADGRYPNGPNSSDTSETETAAPQIIYQKDPELLAAMLEFNAQVRNGIKTELVYSGAKGAKKKMEKFDRFDNKMKMTQSS